MKTIQWVASRILTCNLVSVDKTQLDVSVISHNPFSMEKWAKHMFTVGHCKIDARHIAGADSNQ